MYKIYKLYNNYDLLYVGKTKNPIGRLRRHLSEKEWRNEITHIEIAECRNQIDMDIYEKYYINKLNAKYNIASVYNEQPTFNIEELSFKRYRLKEFINQHKSIELNDKNVNKAMELRKQEMNNFLDKSIEVEIGKRINLLELESNLIHIYNKDKSVVKFLFINGLDFWKDFFNNLSREERRRILKESYTITIKNAEDIWENWNENEFSIKIYSYDINKRYARCFQGFNIFQSATYDKRTKEVFIKLNKFCLNSMQEYFTIDIYE